MVKEWVDAFVGYVLGNAKRLKWLELIDCLMHNAHFDVVSWCSSHDWGTISILVKSSSFLAAAHEATYRQTRTRHEHCKPLVQFLQESAADNVVEYAS